MCFVSISSHCFEFHTEYVAFSSTDFELTVDVV